MIDQTTTGQATLDAALDYAARGWPVFPVYGVHAGRCTCGKPDCGSPGKHPLTAHGLKDASTDPDTICKWWKRSRRANVAIVTGRLSGLLMVGPDGPEGIAQFEELCQERGGLPQTVTAKSGSGGKHYLFAYPLDREIRNAVDCHGLKVDIRGCGGYFIAAPSINANGAYEWLTTPADICGLGGQCEKVPQWLLDWLPTDQEPAANHSTTTPRTTTTSSPDIARRVRAYLKTIPPAVSGRNGHAETYNTALKVVRGFELSIDDAMTFLSEWNTTCQPPWSEKELRHKIEDAHRASGDRGWLLEDDRPAPARTNGHAGRAQAGVTTSGEVHDQVDGLPGIDDPLGRTEIAQGQRLIAAHGRDLRWCDPWKKWLVWNGRCFAKDEACTVAERMKEVVKQQRDDFRSHALELPGKQAGEVISFLRASSKASAIAAALQLARSERGIPVTPDALDAHPWLFNCANGVIDLTTGALLPHDRRYLLTQCSPIDYDPAATCPLWESTIRKTLNGDEQLMRYMQRFFGSALAAEIREHNLPIFHGCGSNGKTLIVETMKEVFGDYANKSDATLLLAGKQDKHPTGLTTLFGKRLVIATETDDGRRLSEATVKEITGGDTITARRMHEDFWSFQPTHKIVLCTNHRPHVRGTDHAIWRRLALVPFEVQFWTRAKGETGPPELEADEHLKHRLQDQYPGILAWLVRGCRDWQKHGLQQPPAVALATQQYREAEDVLGQFIDECCILDRAVDCKASDLWKRYLEWSQERNERPASRTRFGDYLTERGIRKWKSSVTNYAGIAPR